MARRRWFKEFKGNKRWMNWSWNAQQHKREDEETVKKSRKNGRDRSEGRSSDWRRCPLTMRKVGRKWRLRRLRKFEGKKC